MQVLGVTVELAPTFADSSGAILSRRGGNSSSSLHPIAALAGAVVGAIIVGVVVLLVCRRRGYLSKRWRRPKLSTVAASGPAAAYIMTSAVASADSAERPSAQDPCGA